MNLYLEGILKFLIKTGNIEQVIPMDIPVWIRDETFTNSGKLKNTGRVAKSKLIGVFEFCLFSVLMWKND